MKEPIKVKGKYPNLEKVANMAYSCMRCGQCMREVIYDVGRDRVCCVLDYAPGGGFEIYGSRGKNLLIRALLEGKVEPSQELMDAILLCTTCNSCNETCHKSFHPSINFPNSRHMDHANVWEHLRADLRRLGFKYRPGQEAAIDSIKNNNNPYLQPRRAKATWGRKLGIKDLSKTNEPTDVLYFVGCTAALNAEIQPVAEATARLLQKLGVNFGCLFAEEDDCGSILLRLGERELFKEVASRNVKKLNELYDKLGVKTIVTSCAGCFKTMFQDYYDWKDEIGELKAEVLSTSQFIARMIAEGKISFEKGLDIHVTYHDPCHLARHCHVMESPRDVLHALPGVKFTEMRRIKELSWCCGAGGGVRSGFPDIAPLVAQERVKEAEETGAEVLVSTCPFCEGNFVDSIKALGSKLVVKDLAQLIDEALG